MAILLQSQTAVTASATGATSVSLNHTATGSDLYAFVYVNDFEGDTVTGVTYGGVAMTQLAKVSRNPNIGSLESYVYGIFAPATGLQAVVATRTGIVSFMTASVVVLSGANQSNTMNAITTFGADPSTPTATVQANGTPRSQGLTTTVDNCGVLGFFMNDNGGITFTGGATELFNSGITLGVNQSLLAGSVAVATSTPFPLTPAGAHNFSWTQNVAGGQSSIFIAIEPSSAVVTPNSNFLQFM